MARGAAATDRALVRGSTVLAIADARMTKIHYGFSSPRQARWGNSVRAEPWRRPDGIARQQARESGSMDENRFHRWVRHLEGRVTRRGAIGILTAGLTALPLRETAARRREKPTRRGSSKGDVAAQRNAACAARCKDLFPPGKERGQCISDGARGRGPCTKPVCAVQCANDRACCDESGFGCCDDTCTRLDDDGECPPSVCASPPSCTSDAECCGMDRCSCGNPNVCVQFKSLGTGACCKSDDECIEPLLCVATGNGTGACCHPDSPETCICQNC